MNLWGEWDSVCVVTVSYLEQTFRKSSPDLRPQKGAKEEEEDFGPGNIRVIQESPFGELQTTFTTVSPCVPHDGGGSADELHIAGHGLHFHTAFAPGMTVHCCPVQGEKSGGI